MRGINAGAASKERLVLVVVIAIIRAFAVKVKAGAAILRTDVQYLYLASQTLIDA